MQRTSSFKFLSGAAAAVSLCGAGAHAAVTIDGTRSGGDGYTLASTQVLATSSLSDSSGGPQGPGTMATASSTGSFTQLSNVYTQIDTVNNKLNMFIGGSMNTADGGVSHYWVALQTKTGGVANLSNQAVINGSVYQVNNPGNTSLAVTQANVGVSKVSFDTGFLPTALFAVEPNIGATNTGTQAYTGFTDLTGGGASGALGSVAYNGSLQNIPVGTGAVGDPGFAAAATGTEFSIDLTALGYVSGSGVPILATIFTTNGGSEGRTNNQVLAPFTYFAGDTSGGFDYTYVDNNSGSNVGGATGRQFSGSNYVGIQYFAVPGTSVPEPASLGLAA
ncbi:MAG: hypothetical protein JWM57_477, partial [Phycisphaerales bacterium]|nr:hypothetical protein [Phycisphaerales bacterium]